jgi:ribosomal protein S27E
MDKYKCWDCRKEIKDVFFDEETKMKCLKTVDGFMLIICDDCKENED